MTEELLAFIRTITPLSGESRDILLGCLEPAEFAKGEVLLRDGEICNSVFFIARGYCRACYNKDGQEINTGFYFENDFATSIQSLIRKSPSEFAIVAGEKLQTVKLGKEQLLAAYSRSHEIETFGRSLLEQLLARQEEHAALFKLLRPEERYTWLEEKHPEILQRVSLTQLSSYLGVSRETISRIRARRSSR